MILPLNIIGLPYQKTMKQQQRRTVDDHFHHTAIPQQKEVLFDELNMHARVSGRGGRN